jgi:serine protease Do
MSAADAVTTVLDQRLDALAQGVVRIGRGWGRGAGVVLGDGRVATNAHNLRGEQVTVSFSDGTQERGTVAAFDGDGDLAVIDVATGGRTPLPWAAESPRIGQAVLTVTLDAAAGPRATDGRVSALGAAFRSPRGRLIEDAVEHTAPMARGSSGGPLLDLEGRLLGLNTHRRGDGFYLAVPATSSLRDRLDALATGIVAARPRLGVAVAPPEVARRLREAVGLPDREGLLVRGVEEHGPADRAGVRRGDLLVVAGGTTLRSSDDLFGVLDALASDAELPLQVVRGTDEVDLVVRFAD